MSRTFRSRSSDHVPVVPTMVSSGAVGVKRIHVFRNADAFFQGIQVVVNTHRVPSMDVLLDVINERIGLLNGAKKLYTTGGVLVKNINKINDGQSYVASSAHFTPMSYGGQVVKKEEKKKKKKKRSKTVHSVERKEKHLEKGEEVVIPFNEHHEHNEHREPNSPEKIKEKKKKRVVKKKKEHGSSETLAETAEVELPSELEDSEIEEHHHKEQDHHEHNEDSHSRGGRSSLQSPEPSRPSTAFRHNTSPPRSASRRGSRREPVEQEEEKKKEKKSVADRRKSQPNWGDLSSFTKNIESLLKN